MDEYIPFIALLLALYTVSGGILVWGKPAWLAQNEYLHPRHRHPAGFRDGDDRRGDVDDTPAAEGQR